MVKAVTCSQGRIPLHLLLRMGRCGIYASVVASVIGYGIALGQEISVALPAASPPPGATAEAPVAKGETAAAASSEPKKEGENKPAAEGEKKGEGAPAEGAAETVKRPKTPPRVPDPREFDARLDRNARVTFSFHGQSWPDVLQWLATLSGYSLDWQELPNDYVNLSTERPFTIVETRDLVNRLLLERGYVTLLQGQLLTVAKIDKLDPSLIPRIEDEAELLDLPAHELVKISFELPDKLKADQAATDVKLLLSPHGKVHPLMATNRLLVIDVVGNLREVSRLVNSEHAAAESHELPKEFVLRHARADRVADQVMILLGLDPSSRRTPEELQVEQQRLQLFAQMQQRGADVTKYLRPGETPSVFITVNHQRNSLLVNAPPAEVEVISRAIEMLDVGPTSAGLSDSSESLTMTKYQTVTLKPQTIVSTLEEIGDLDPRSRLRIDADSNALIAHATSADHKKIDAIIDRLDGTGRQFEVIWLKRLPADRVATTIFNLMIGPEKDDKDDDRNYYRYYSYWDQPSSNDNKKSSDGFRVDADVEKNRILLWATESEMAEVRELLQKLGEIPGEASNPHTVRYLDLGNRELTTRLLDELRRTWPAVGGNSLDIQHESNGAGEKQETPPAQDREASYRPTAEPQVQLVASVEAESAAPPIRIDITEDGRLMLSSPDTASLDRMEELLDILAPPAREFAVFDLKYAMASMVTLNLEEYFEDVSDKKDNSAEDYWRGWYGFDFNSDSQEGPTGLSSRKPIRFIYDIDTNSIVVTNASRDQLRTIEALIDVYDKPPSEESISARRFRIFPLKHAKAEAVAKTIKEVYRDLLSSKDKEFVGNNKDEKQQSSQTAGIYRIFSGPEADNTKEKPTKIKASFAGALSIGIDDVSNTVIVSAQEEWMTSIAEMIDYLDGESSPYTPATSVVTTRINPRVLQAALAKIAGSPSKPQEDKAKTESNDPKNQSVPSQNNADRNAPENGITPASPSVVF